MAVNFWVQWWVLSISFPENTRGIPPRGLAIAHSVLYTTAVPCVYVDILPLNEWMNELWSEGSLMRPSDVRYAICYKNKKKVFMRLLVLVCLWGGGGMEDDQELLAGLSGSSLLLFLLPSPLPPIPLRLLSPPTVASSRSRRARGTNETGYGHQEQHPNPGSTRVCLPSPSHCLPVTWWTRSEEECGK